MTLPYHDLMLGCLFIHHQSSSTSQISKKPCEETCETSRDNKSASTCARILRKQSRINCCSHALLLVPLPVVWQIAGRTVVVCVKGPSRCRQTTRTTLPRWGSRRCARKSIHHPTKMRSETPCSTTGTSSSGLADRRAPRCGTRAMPVRVPTNREDNSDTLGIRLHHSAIVQSNLPAGERPK